MNDSLPAISTIFLRSCCLGMYGSARLCLDLIGLKRRSRTYLLSKLFWCKFSKTSSSFIDEFTSFSEEGVCPSYWCCENPGAY
jgi:hypothetical protein